MSHLSIFEIIINFSIGWISGALCFIVGSYLSFIMFCATSVCMCESVAMKELSIL